MIDFNRGRVKEDVADAIKSDVLSVIETCFSNLIPESTTGTHQDLANKESIIIAIEKIASEISFALEDEYFSKNRCGYCGKAIRNKHVIAANTGKFFCDRDCCHKYVDEFVIEEE